MKERRPDKETTQTHKEEVSAPFDLEITRKKLYDALHGGLRMREIAELFNAQEYIQKIGKGASEGMQFNVSAFLTDLQQRGEQFIMPEKISSTKEIFLPPDERDIVMTGESGERREEPEYIPRTRYLIDLLSELGLPYEMISGSVTERMMRKRPYVVFDLSTLQKAIFVNNEEGNATFVVRLGEGDSWHRWSKMGKNDLKTLGALGKVVQVNWSDEVMWKAEVQAALLSMDEDVSMTEDQIFREPPEGYIALADLPDISILPKNRKKYLLRVIRSEYASEIVKVLLEGDGLPQIKEYVSPRVFDFWEQKMAPFEQFPEGWLSRKSVAGLFKIGFSTVERLEALYVNPETAPSGDYTDGYNRIGHYLSPALIEKIREHLEQEEEVPDGWMTKKHMAHELRTHPAKLEQHFAELGLTPGVDVKSVQHRTQNFTYYAPWVLSLVREQIEKQHHVMESVEGWKTVAAVGRELGIDHYTVLRRIEKYKADPKFVKMTEGRGLIRTYLSQECVAAIHAEIERMLWARENWLTVPKMAAMLKCDRSTIERKIEKLSDEQKATWIFIDDPVGGRAGVVYINPFFGEQFQAEREAMQVAPDGWIPKSAARKEFRMDDDALQSLITEADIAETEYGDYTPATNVGVRTYFSPDAMQKLKEAYDRQFLQFAAPGGWMSVMQVAENLHVSEAVIAQAFKKAKKTNPEWVKLFRSAKGKGAEAQYASPDFIAYLKDLRQRTLSGELQRLDNALGSRREKRLGGGESGTEESVNTTEKEGDISMPKHRREELQERKQERIRELLAVRGDDVGKESLESGAGTIPDAPVDWISGWTMGKWMNRAQVTAERRAREIAAEKGRFDWIQMMRIPGRGQKIVHFAPELVELVSKSFEQKQVAPASWLTVYAMSKALEISGDRIRTAIKKINSGDPELHQKFFEPEMGREWDYYSPKAQAMIREIVYSKKKKKDSE